MANFDFSGFTTLDLLRLAQMALMLVNNRFSLEKVDFRDSSVFFDSTALAGFCTSFHSIYNELRESANIPLDD